MWASKYARCRVCNPHFVCTLCRTVALDECSCACLEAALWLVCIELHSACAVQTCVQQQQQGERGPVNGRCKAGGHVGEGVWELCQKEAL